MTLSKTYFKYISESVYKETFLILEKINKLAFNATKIYKIKTFVEYMTG